MTSPDREIFALEVVEDVPYLKWDASLFRPDGVVRLQSRGSRRKGRGNSKGYVQIESWMISCKQGPYTNLPVRNNRDDI